MVIIKISCRRSMISTPLFTEEDLMLSLLSAA